MIGLMWKIKALNVESGQLSRVQSVVGAPKARHDSGWLFPDGILW